MVFEELNAKQNKKSPSMNKSVEKKQNPHGHPSSLNSKVEIRPTIQGSLGEVTDEGCFEHRDVRFVLEELPKEEHKRKEKLKEYFVFSEILGKPKCKK